MGKNITTGSASAGLTAEEPTTCPGLDRLQTTGQQSVDEAQDGPWVVWASGQDYAWTPTFYPTRESALNAWVFSGGYVCKNLTPV